MSEIVLLMSLTDGRIGAGGFAIFFCRSHYAADIHIKTAVAVVPSARLKRVVMNAAVGLCRSGCVLQLIPIALGQLRRLTYLWAELFQVRWIGSAARLSVGMQLGINVLDRNNSVSFRFSGEIARAWGYHEPEKAPHGGEEHAQQHSPAQQDFRQGRLLRRRGEFPWKAGQVRTAVRTDFCRLVNFVFAFAAGNHI